jgi:ketosteroid isomerase-like protein
MSEESVEVVKGAFAAHAAGEEVPDGIHPDVVWNPAEELPMHGAEAVKEHMRRWEGEWEDLRTTPEEFADHGDRVLVTVHFAGKGVKSGIEIDVRVYEIYTVRGGRIVRMDEYTEKSAALEAIEQAA